MCSALVLQPAPIINADSRIGAANETQRFRLCRILIDTPFCSEIGSILVWLLRGLILAELTVEAKKVWKKGFSREGAKTQSLPGPNQRSLCSFAPLRFVREILSIEYFSR